MSDFQPAPAQRTNGLAIAGFITSLLCCAPIGIILSVIGLGQIAKDPSQSGKGLAYAGLIIGVVSFVFGVLYYIFVFALGMEDVYDYGY